jgi:hypothetical protein
MGELGLTLELHYQWNPVRHEIYVFAVICEEPLIEWSLGDDLLWKIFGSESLLYVGGCKADLDPNCITRSDLKHESGLIFGCVGCA